MYTHTGNSQVLTKYADFIQHNPEYIKKVIDPNSSDSITFTEKLELAMTMQTLDPENFILDTIKYTELYPNRPGSSGFNSNSSNPSSTESAALRKNLIDFDGPGEESEEHIDRALIDDLDLDEDEETEIIPQRLPVRKQQKPQQKQKQQENQKQQEQQQPPPALNDLGRNDPDPEEGEDRLLDDISIPTKDSGGSYEEEAGEHSDENDIPAAFRGAFEDEDETPIVAAVQHKAKELKALPLPKSEEEQEVDDAYDKFSETKFVGNRNIPTLPAAAAAAVPEMKPFTKDSDKFFKNELFGSLILPEKNNYQPPPKPNASVSAVRPQYSVPQQPVPIPDTQSQSQSQAHALVAKITQQKNTQAPAPAPAAPSNAKPEQFQLPPNQPKPIPKPPNDNLNNNAVFKNPPVPAPSNLPMSPSYNQIPPKQVVRYQSVLPTWSPPPIRRRIAQMPGILRRYNMEQWVAKIIWLYTNGDERHRRVEYRFRPEKDVRTFEGLCDILSQRLGLTRGVRYIYSMSGRPIHHLDDLTHENSYVVSSTKKFKALNYTGDQGVQNYRQKASPIPPQQKMALPPVIRVRRDNSRSRSLREDSPRPTQKSKSKSRSRSRSPNPQAMQPQQQQQQMQMQMQNYQMQAYGGNSPIEDFGVIKRNSPAVSEAEKLLNAVIGETNPVQRKVVRIINGENPSLQSQVLLNTRVSQEWEDLVRDLSLAVKFPKSLKCHLETLVGRKVLSYSQLRAELNAGNQTFYIYGNNGAPRTSGNSSQTLETLKNMKNLSLQDAKKTIYANLPPVMKKSTNSKSLPSNDSNNNYNFGYTTMSKVEGKRNRRYDDYN